MPQDTKAAMVASVHRQHPNLVLDIYDKIMRSGGPLRDMDHVVVEQAPHIVGAAASRETDQDLAGHLDFLERRRLGGSTAIPSWSILADATIREVIKRHPEVESALAQADPDDSPLTVASKALRAVINP